MPLEPSIGQYVKFIRGTPSAFAALKQKNNDTLYFIYEKDEDVGSLYLGNRLVSRGISEENLGISLAALTDVEIGELSDKQLLGYDALTGKWTPMTIEAIVQISVMIGATETQAGVSGTVPPPKAGEQSHFLRGDGTWHKAITEEYIKSVDEESFSVDENGQLHLNDLDISDIDGLETALDDKVDKQDGWTLLSPVNQQKLEALIFNNNGVELSGKVNVNNVEGLANWIETNRNALSGLYPVSHSNKLMEIQNGAQVNFINSVDTEAFTVTPARKLLLNEIPPSKVTGLSALSSAVTAFPNTYVSIAKFNKVVGNLDIMLANRTTTLEEDILNLDERLTWQEMK